MIFTNNCPSNENYVYLNKVFYNDSENSSPIMTPIDSTTAELTQQLKIGANLCDGGISVTRIAGGSSASPGNCGCGCGSSQVSASNCGCGTSQVITNNYGGCDCCCDFLITADTVFNITNSYVLVRSFRLTDPASLTTEDITVEGLPITALTPNGNQFVADISDIMREIARCDCISPCEDPCPGEFVMVTAAGPWELAATIVVEGTVYGNGPSCQFKICYNTVPATLIPVTGPASFAFCDANIPCQISGISPTLVFDFDACAKFLNPTITVTCTDGVCTPILSGALVVTPRVNLQVIRPSLFNLGNTEVQLPCDDMGQCNPCDDAESKCIDTGISCQCCDTNGYRF